MVLGKRSRSPVEKKKELDDPSKWTVAKLKEWLEDEGLAANGVKKTLVDRVVRAQKGEVDSEDEDEKDDFGESEDDGDNFGDSSEEEDLPPPPVSKRSKRTLKTSFWTTHESIIYLNAPESPDTGKIAAFDMDTTLVRPKSGKIHPQGRSDWVWMFEEVPSKLAQLHKDGYKIVIMSNQKGLSTGASRAQDIQGKIDDLAADCKVPLCAILATEDDIYRKPSPAMFTFCAENLITAPIDLKESFYIGDAAGRPAGWAEGKKKDHGCSDRKFAVNAGVPFQTPEEYFLGEKAVEFSWLTINPTEIAVSTEQPFKSEALVSAEQEVIVFVGFPASGKSTFAKTYLLPSGYVHVNRDTLGTPAKCLAATKAALAQGKSVVVDNTSPSKSVRESYIKAAQSASVPVRCFHFQTSLEIAQHMNSFREVLTEGQQRHVPGVGFNTYKKHFEAPTTEEGFKEVKQIEFKRYHPDEHHRKLFEQWTERLR